MTSRQACVNVLLACMMLIAPHVAGDQSVTVDHNGSEMRIEVISGGAMTITYAHPRAGLQDAGLIPGTVLFKGRIVGRDITGDARAFKRGCEPASYSVTGAVGEGRIVLRGPGPVRSGCAIARLDPASPHAELVFTGKPDALSAIVTASRNIPATAPASLRTAILQNPHMLIAAGDRAWEEMRERPTLSDQHQLFLETCDVLLDGGSQDDVFIERAQFASSYHYGVAQALAEAGYPAQVWKAPLDRLTNARMDVLVDRRRRGLDLLDENSVRAPVIPYENQLVAALESYRARNGRSLPSPAPLPPVCGGDYVGYVHIATDPSGGVVRVIREFYFKLCGVTGIPPYSDRCDKWLVTGSGTQVPVGSYRYAARWPDGHSECDRIELGANPDTEGRVVKIARSGRTCQDERP